MGLRAEKSWCHTNNGNMRKIIFVCLDRKCFYASFVLFFGCDWCNCLGFGVIVFFFCWVLTVHMHMSFLFFLTHLYAMSFAPNGVKKNGNVDQQYTPYYCVALVIDRLLYFAESLPGKKKYWSMPQYIPYRNVNIYVYSYVYIYIYNNFCQLFN